MIIASGFKVYPRRIEDALYDHAAIEEVTVVGIPDAYRGEAPKAFVKLKEGEQATAAELTNSCGRSSPRSNCRPKSSFAIRCPRRWWANCRRRSCAPSARAKPDGHAGVRHQTPTDSLHPALTP